MRRRTSNGSGRKVSNAADRGLPSRLQIHIAQQILDLIREDALAAGHHLREESLAHRLGVSRTSVRGGLRILCRHDFVVARPNRGFALARSADQLKTAIEWPTSADESLYWRIARDLVLGKLPRSTTETELMRRYDSSRNLVLAALAILSKEGLVRRGRGREWDFQEVLNSASAQRQSFELRLMIEPPALLLPSFSVDVPRLTRAREEQRALMQQPRGARSLRELFHTDASFHELLARLSGNAFVLEAVRQQNRLRRLMEYESYPDAQRVRAWCREHIAVIDALLDGDRALASRRLSEHLRNAMSAPFLVVARTRGKTGAAGKDRRSLPELASR